MHADMHASMHASTRAGGPPEGHVVVNSGMSTVIGFPALPTHAPVLVIEAATAAGSVALLQGEERLASRQVTMGAGMRDGLFPALEALLHEAAIAPGQLGAVVCGAGPGSFTSLRIAASLAKGLAHGSGVPLYAVPSLLIAAAALPAQVQGEFVVHADALRGERYALPVHRGPTGAVMSAGPVARITVETLRTQTSEAQRVAVLESPAALPSAWTVSPDAAGLTQAMGNWREAPVELAAWEPQYGRLAEAQVKWEAAHGHPLPQTALRGA